MKIDMHCHTLEGSPDGKIPIREYIKLLKDNDIDGMLVTDHDSYNGYRHYCESLKDYMPEITVLKGIEYDTFEAGHFLVIMPDGVELKILEMKGLPVLALIEIVHRNGGILGPAHPAGEQFLSIFSTGYFKKHHDICKRFDFMEGFNACQDMNSNARALAIASEFGCVVTAGSDSHYHECVGSACTEFDEQITCNNDLIAYIKAKKPTHLHGRIWAKTLRDKLGVFNNILLWAFYPYNKYGAMIKRKMRRQELKQLHKSCKI